MRALLAILLLLAVWSPPARAQEPDAQSQADAMIREGVELRKQGRESDAYEKFREAHRVHPSARALGQMGLAAKSIRLYVNAEKFLEAALVAGDDPWVQQNREALQLARDVVAKQLASIVVRANVAGAELFVNGDRVATLPLDQPLRVPAGAPQVEVRAPGYATARSDVTLPAGVTTELSFELQPEAPSAPPPAPQPMAPLARTPPPDAPSPRRPWIYASAGLGLVGVAVGAVSGAIMLSKKAERDEICGDGIIVCPKEGVDADEDARTAAHVATVGFIAGGVGLGAVLVLWLSEPKSKATGLVPRVSAGPTLAGPGAGAAWTF